MKAAVLDIGNGDAIRTFAEKKLKNDYPALNVVIHNAGIMKTESLKDGAVCRCGSDGDDESAWANPSETPRYCLFFCNSKTP